MSVSQVPDLIAQFYNWELRGRGWFCAGFPVELEPPFVPFYGHYIPRPYIDDGKKETIISQLTNLFRSSDSTPVIRTYDTPLIEPFPNTDESGLVALRLTFPKQYKLKSESMEQFFIMLSHKNTPVSFELIAASDIITIQLVCRIGSESFLISQLASYFPDLIYHTVYEVYDLFDADRAFYTIDYGLKEEFMRPIVQASGGDNDIFIGLYGIFEQLGDDERVVLQILFSGTGNPWAESMTNAVTDGFKGSFFEDAPEMPSLTNEKTSRPLFAVCVRLLAQAEREDDALDLLERLNFALATASTSKWNALHPLTNDNYTVQQRIEDIALRQSHRLGMLLNSRELSALAHFPTSAIISKKLANLNQRTKQAPNSVIGHDYILGINSHYGTAIEASLSTEQRLRHIHVMGATGTGKSTLLRNLILQDAEQGNGFCVLDPHGDLIDSILLSIPNERLRDVVLIDPTDSEFPVGCNILTAYSDIEREVLASDLVALFRRFSTSWGDQMNSVFANSIAAFVYNTKPGHLGDLRKFLIDTAFRKEYLQTVTDPDIAYYWTKEFPILKSTSIGPILTRLDAFLRPKVIRAMVCQNQSLNFGELMDTSKIVLVKLSQGLLGAENSYLLGAFIVSKLQQTAMSRQAQDARSRIPFYLYIDEFHHFITPSMASILSGARKYALGLVLVHQDMQQVSKYDTEIANSLLSNAGCRIYFRLGDTDAKRVQDGFSGFTADDLQNLTVGDAIARVNTPDADFSLSVEVFEQSSNQDNKAIIIANSRSVYSVPLVSEAPQLSNEAEPDPIEPARPTPVTPTQPQAKRQATSEPLKPADNKVPVQPTETVGTKSAHEVREHRYLQTFIKKLAEEYGYKAGIEVPTPDGSGFVDVLLEREQQTLAVEISVSTNATWELHNIQKCLSSGYSTVVVCSSHTKRLEQLKQKVLATCSVDQQKRVTFTTPENIQAILTQTTHKTPTETVMKGYRVKVNYEHGGMNKQDILKTIMQSAPKP